MALPTDGDVALSPAPIADEIIQENSDISDKNGDSLDATDQIYINFLKDVNMVSSVSLDEIVSIIMKIKLFI